MTDPSAHPPTLTIPPSHRQLTFLLTGSLAGFSTLPITSLLTRSLSIPITSPILRPAPRFWTFDLVRSNLPPSFPIPLAGGLSGAAGGAVEVLSHALVANRALPSLYAVASHSGRLFLGFGTFTGLSSVVSEEFPPRPFVFCWGLGAVAGAVGTAGGMVVESGGRVGGRGLVRGMGVGAVVVGTVISVQVTCCARVLEWVEGRGE